MCREVPEEDYFLIAGYREIIEKDDMKPKKTGFPVFFGFIKNENHVIELS